MASFSAGTTFTDGVANDVTAAKLGALVNNATPTSGLIQDRTAETVTATNDTLLIGDASDSNNLKRITVANFAQTLPTAKVTTGTIETGTFGTTTSTAATITTGTITTCVIPTGTFGTTTSTAATITTGTIPTLVATTLVTTGTGTAAAPAIAPTGDTNTGLFFPAADTIAFAGGGVESMRIDANGNVGVGTNSVTSSYKLDARGWIRAQHPSGDAVLSVVAGNATGSSVLEFGDSASDNVGRVLYNHTGNYFQFNTSGTERLRIDSSGNVGINDSSPSTRLSAYSASADGLVIASGGIPTLIFSDTSSTTYSALGQNGTSLDIFNNAAGSIRVYTSGTERLRIDSDGDVSIGTATALSKLHVHGNITLSNTTTATSAGTGGLSKPATYAGYLTVSINGTSRKIPYYAT